MAKKTVPVQEEENSDFEEFLEEEKGGEEISEDEPSSDMYDFASDTEPAPAPIKKGGKGKGRGSASPLQAPSGNPEGKTVGLAADVPVQLIAVMGKKTMTVKEILSLKKGQVLELNRFPNEAIDIVVGGKLMAKGELVEVDGKLGVRIIKIFE
jgi:type III secretion system YscQ/HrcQ family protein